MNIIGPLNPRIPNTYQLNQDYYFYSFRGTYHSCNALNMVMIVWLAPKFLFLHFAWGISCFHGKDLKSALPHSVFPFSKIEKTRLCPRST